MKILVLIALLIASLSSQASTVILAWTNFVAGVSFTNDLQVYMVGDQANFDGTWLQAGPAITMSSQSGFYTNVFRAGNFAARIIPNKEWNNPPKQSILFAVPNDTNTYQVGQLLLSGYNFYNYTPGVLSIQNTDGSVTVTPTNGRGNITISALGLNATNATYLNGIAGTATLAIQNLASPTPFLSLSQTGTNPVQLLLTGNNTGTNQMASWTGVLSTNATNWAGILSTNATNWAGTLSTNATNAIVATSNAIVSILPTAFNGTALTNLIGVLSTNATNFAGILSTNATNWSGILATNGTNFALSLATNATNFALTVATNATNYALAQASAAEDYTSDQVVILIGDINLASNLAEILSTNATNFAGILSTNATNFALFLSTNATNFALTVATNATNYTLTTALTVATNATNFAESLGVSETNWVGVLSTNATNFSLTVATNATNFALTMGTTISNVFQTGSLILSNFDANDTVDSSGNLTANSFTAASSVAVSLLGPTTFFGQLTASVASLFVGNVIVTNATVTVTNTGGSTTIQSNMIFLKGTNTGNATLSPYGLTNIGNGSVAFTIATAQGDNFNFGRFGTFYPPNIQTTSEIITNTLTIESGYITVNKDGSDYGLVINGSNGKEDIHVAGAGSDDWLAVQGTNYLSSGNPVYVNEFNGGDGRLYSSYIARLETVHSGNYTMALWDSLVVFTGGGGYTCTLPVKIKGTGSAGTASDIGWMQTHASLAPTNTLDFFVNNESSGTVTLSDTNSDNIIFQGAIATSLVLQPGGYVHLWTDGTSIYASGNQTITPGAFITAATNGDGVTLTVNTTLTNGVNGQLQADGVTITNWVNANFATVGGSFTNLLGIVLDPYTNDYAVTFTTNGFIVTNTANTNGVTVVLGTNSGSLVLVPGQLNTNTLVLRSPTNGPKASILRLDDPSSNAVDLFSTNGSLTVSNGPVTVTNVAGASSINGGNIVVITTAGTTTITPAGITNSGVIVALGGVQSPGAGISSLQIGAGADAFGSESIAIGPLAGSTANASIAIGYHATNYGIANISIGDFSEALDLMTLAIGYSAEAITGAPYSTVVGPDAISESASNECFGLYAWATGNNSVVIGAEASQTGFSNSVAVGNWATVYADSTALGFWAQASNNCVAIGDSANTLSFSNAIAIGNFVTNTANNQAVFGPGVALTGLASGLTNANGHSVADQTVTNGINTQLTADGTTITNYINAITPGSFNGGPLTNWIGILSTNATNFALTVATNATNFADSVGIIENAFTGVLSTNATNWSGILSTNATNFSGILSTNSTNFAGILSTNATNFSGILSTNSTNWAGVLSTNATNFSLTVATNATNFAQSLGVSITNYINAITPGSFNGTALTNYAGLLSTNATNFSGLLSTNTTNFAKSWSGILSTNDTNFAESWSGTLSTNATNWSGILSTNATNFSGILSTNSTNFAGIISTNSTNFVESWSGILSTNATNFINGRFISIIATNNVTVTNGSLLGSNSLGYYFITNNQLTLQAGQGITNQLSYLNGQLSNSAYFHNGGAADFGGGEFTISSSGAVTSSSEQTAGSLLFGTTFGISGGMTIADNSGNLSGLTVTATNGGASAVINIDSASGSGGALNFATGGTESWSLNPSGFGSTHTFQIINQNNSHTSLSINPSSDLVSVYAGLSVPGQFTATGGAALSGSVTVPNATLIPAQNGNSTTTVDWSAGMSQSNYLNGNYTYTMANTTAGQSFTISVTDSGGHTITWAVPGGIALKWPGGTQPTQTAGKTDVYTFIQIGTTIYGSVVQNF